MKTTVIVALTLLIGISSHFTAREFHLDREAKTSELAISILLINEYPKLFQGDRLIDGLTLREHEEMIHILEDYIESGD